MENKQKALVLVQKLIKERSGVDVAFELDKDGLEHGLEHYVAPLNLTKLDSCYLESKYLILRFLYSNRPSKTLNVNVRIKEKTNIASVEHEFLELFYEDETLKIREVDGSLVEWKPKLTIKQYAKEVFEADVENMGFEVLSANIAEFNGTLDKKIYEFLRSGLSSCESYWGAIDKMGFERDTYCQDLAKEYALLFIFKDDERSCKIL